MTDAVKEYAGVDFDKLKLMRKQKHLAKQIKTYKLKQKLEDCTKGEILNLTF